MAQQIADPSRIIRPPVRKEEMDREKDQIRNIDLQETLFHEFPEADRMVQVAQIETKAGAEDKNMAAGSSERGSVTQPLRNVSIVPVYLKEVHEHNTGHREAAEKRDLIIFPISAFYSQAHIPFRFILRKLSVLIYVDFMAGLCYHTNKQRQVSGAVGPHYLPRNDRRAASYDIPSGKEGCPMVTYSELIQLGILIVGIISLFIQANKK